MHALQTSRVTRARTGYRSQLEILHVLLGFQQHFSVTRLVCPPSFLIVPEIMLYVRLINNVRSDLIFPKPILNFKHVIVCLYSLAFCLFF